VLAVLAPYTQGVLNSRVEGRIGLTPYAWWAAHFGLWPLALLAACVVAAAARRARRLAPAA
jgi:apolipoprotein N-acyltransferase